MNLSPIRIAMIDAQQTAMDGSDSWLAVNRPHMDVVVAETRWHLFAEKHDRVGGADVVVLDVELRDRLPLLLHLPTLLALGMKVVLLGRGTDPNFIREALRSGASSYVDRRESLTALAEAIQAAADGTADSSAHARAPQPAHNLILTPRERQVVAGIASDLTMHAVADALHISVNTAQGYLKDVRARSKAAGRDLGTVIAIRTFALESGYILG